MKLQTVKDNDLFVGQIITPVLIEKIESKIPEKIDGNIQMS